MVTRHGPVGRRSWHIDRLDAGAKTDYRSGRPSRQATSGSSRCRLQSRAAFDRAPGLMRAHSPQAPVAARVASGRCIANCASHAR